MQNCLSGAVWVGWVKIGRSASRDTVNGPTLKQLERYTYTTRVGATKTTTDSTTIYRNHHHNYDSTSVTTTATITSSAAIDTSGPVLQFYW